MDLQILMTEVFEEVLSRKDEIVDLAKNFVKRLGLMWYIMDPNEHLYEHVKDVPDYYKEVTPAFIFVIFFEQFLHFIQGKRLMRLNDSVTNISQGILVELFKIPLYGIELIFYVWIYNNLRVFSLPWNSPWTWLLCMVVNDFLFYWMHRGTHQISILWYFHEPHHSSEEYNLTTPLRLSIFTTAGFWIAYLPMAFFIPPSTFFVHHQLNVIFQYWLHSEYIPRLGYLEYVFVTPSHHRVHHGRNRRCIDKNFGSIFILWDRIFGTFEPEGTEKINFGVTKPLQTFNPITIQTNHLQTICQRFMATEGIVNKLSCIFKGPGWSPGKPWVGHLEDIPEPKEDDKKYDPNIPFWLKLYVIFHMIALVSGYLQMIFFMSKISTWILTISVLYMMLTTVAIGYLLDFSSWGPIVEIVRCPLYFLLDVLLQKEFSSGYVILHASMYAYRSIFFFSFVLWLFAIPLVVKNKTKVE
ncbi:hypothetical protein JTE90_009682 [Oedothorax gibbosus]|uniref:Fatty acid hydroxylase domain-containing protein n=1 Tax=Oedothorax gibbosus TaxID=931172 RepID=A0AAV6V9Q3_9ARAC|nr:hypothetical protein JTE90_009682 [Oedothorax gibbosus]